MRSDVSIATRLRQRFAILVAAAAISLVLSQRPALAHELRPAIVAVTISRSGDVELSVALNLEAYVAGIGPEHSNTAQSPQAANYDALRSRVPDALGAVFRRIEPDFVAGLALGVDGKPAMLSVVDVMIPPVGDTSLARFSTIHLRGHMPAEAETVTWRADPLFGATVIRLSRDGENVPFFAAYQAAGEATVPVPLDGVIDPGRWASFVRFITIGFQHIVPKGLDHILFVVGLFLLSPQFRPLLSQVTGFTVAHSVSLALGIYGVVRVSPTIVEPLIAASIVFVCVENLFTDRLQRWRPAVVFGFGLLHGLGFAGVLQEVGLPRSQFVTALIGFNLGVELGQLTVLGGCFLGVGLWFRHREWYRRAITIPASMAVALVAVYWFFERIA